MRIHPPALTAHLLQLSLRNSAHALAYYAGASRHGLRVSLSRGSIDVIDSAGGRMIRLRRDHWPYARDMVDHFDYYFDSVVPFRMKVGGRSFDIVDFSSPRFHAVRGFAGVPLYHSSLVEPYRTCQQYLEFAQLRPGQTVLDLGAYSGLTSIAFARAVGRAGLVVALEPDPENFSASQTNLELAARAAEEMAPVRLLPIAASSTSGRVLFCADGAMGSSQASILRPARRGDTVWVESLPLDEIAGRMEFSCLDFLKMDIEGAEIDVLSSSRDFFHRFRPRVVVEPHVVHGRLCDQLISEQLRRYGYRCRTVHQNGASLPLVTAEPYEVAESCTHV